MNKQNITIYMIEENSQMSSGSVGKMNHINENPYT